MPHRWFLQNQEGYAFDDVRQPRTTGAGSRSDSADSPYGRSDTAGTGARAPGATGTHARAEPDRPTAGTVARARTTT